MRRIWRRVLAAGAVAGVAGAMAVALLNDTPLTERAAPVAGGVVRYAWRSPSQMVVFERDKRTYLIDLKTHAQRALTVPVMLPRNATVWGTTPQVTPDGRWLVRADDSGSETSVSSIDGRDAYRAAWPVPNAWDVRPWASGRGPAFWPTGAWLPDSERFVTLEASEQGRPMARVRQVGEYRSVQIQAPAGLRALLGVTPDMRLIGTDVPFETHRRRPNIRLFEVPLYPNAGPDRVWTIQLPGHEWFHSVTLSPDGRTLAWQLAETHRVRGVATLSRVFRFLAHRFPPRSRHTVWLSDLHGREFRRLGSQDVTGQPKRFPDLLRWRPDSRAVSFLYDGTVFVLPVR